MLVTGELFPASRALADEVEATEMTGVEHLGQYVYEMTQAKLKQLNGHAVITRALPDIIEDDDGSRRLADENSEGEDESFEAQPEDLEDSFGVVQNV